MYQALMQAVNTRPAPYAPTEYPFWDDPHISGHFLKAHLNPGTEAATRNQMFVYRSADWIAQLAKGRLLDLGCGPGIYAEHFTRRGFRVTGVDISARSIDYARASAKKQGMDIDYRHGSYLALDLEAEYDIAVMIYCDFGVLGPEDRSTLLRGAYRALKPGGLLVLDAWTREHYRAFEEDIHIANAPDGGFWSAQPHITIEQKLMYPEGIYLDRYHIITEEALRTYNVWNRAFDDAQLANELWRAVFKSIDFYGNVAGAAYLPGSETLCAVARK